VFNTGVITYHIYMAKGIVCLEVAGFATDSVATAAAFLQEMVQ
jgi:ABC-type microcin C transport system permease subunit YejB